MAIGKKQLGPLMGIQFDQLKEVEYPPMIQGKRTHGKPRHSIRTFRIVTYQAYNVMGLVDFGYNGVAILDEDEKKILCDCIACEETGFFGVSPAQTAEAERIVAMSDEEFKAFVNSHPQRRYEI